MSTENVNHRITPKGRNDDFEISDGYLDKGGSMNKKDSVWSGVSIGLLDD